MNGKHTTYLLALLLLLLCFQPAIAAAESMLLSGESSFLLHDGDTIHLLTLDYTDIVYDETTFQSTYDPHYSCQEITREHTFVPCDKDCATMLQNEGYHEFIRDENQQTYWINEKQEIYRWRPEAEGAKEYITTIDMDLSFQTADRYFDALIIESENTLLFTINYQNQRSEFYKASLTDGKAELLRKKTGLMGEPTYIDRDRVFLHVGEGLKEYAYNWKTGEKEAVPGIFNGGHLVAFPDENGGWLYQGVNGIYKRDSKGKDQTLFSMPIDMFAGVMSLRDDEAIFIAIQGQKYYLFFVPLESPRHKLELVGAVSAFQYNLGIVPSMLPFLTAHNNLQLSPSDESLSENDLAQRLILCDDHFDVMVLNSSGYNLRKIYEKGYYVDLSELAGVRAFMEEIHPIFRDACMIDGKIAAVPLSVLDVSMMVNTRLWQELELGDYPTTLDELLDVIAECFEEGILDEHRLFYSDYYPGSPEESITAYEHLLDQMLLRYIVTMQRDEGTLSFQNERFIMLFDKLQGLRERLNDHSRRNLIADALFYPSKNLSTFGNLSGSECFEPLLLGVTAGDRPITPTFVTVMMLNPFGKNIELSKALLEYIAQQPTALTRCGMTREQPMGILAAGEEEREAEYQQELAVMQERYEAALKDEDVELMITLEDAIETLKLQRRTSTYEVTPEAAAAYYAVLPYAQLIDSDGYGFVTDNGKDLLNAFMQGQLDARTLARRLDQLLDMKRMEEQ